MNTTSNPIGNPTRTRRSSWAVVVLATAGLTLVATGPVAAHAKDESHGGAGQWIREPVDAFDDDFWGPLPDGRGLPRWESPPSPTPPEEEVCDGAIALPMGHQILWICPPTHE